MSDVLIKVSNAYTNKRNDAIWDSSILDVVLLGLGAAAIINPIYHGATAATVGLGLAGGSVGAARVYLSPQTRIDSYNSAAGSLACASGVSGIMGDLYQSNATPLSDAEENLVIDMKAAAALLTSGKALGTAGDKLLIERDSANATLTKVRDANGALQGGRTGLKAFAIVVIETTSKNVYSGTHNFDQALKQVSQLSPTTGKAPTTNSPGVGVDSFGGKAGVERSPYNMNASELTAQIASDSPAAELLADPVNTAWKQLDSCKPSS